MNAPSKKEELLPQNVAFQLDGKTIHAYAAETIFNAAQRNGVAIPHLCYKDGMRPDGNCRACVVEIQGERTLAPSCCRNVTAGMEVSANSERAIKSQKMVLEMLLSDMPDKGYKWNDVNPASNASSAKPAGQHGELSGWADHLEVTVRPELKALRHHRLPIERKAEA